MNAVVIYSEFSFSFSLVFPFPISICPSALLTFKKRPCCPRLKRGIRLVVRTKKRGLLPAGLAGEQALDASRLRSDRLTGRRRDGHRAGPTGLAG